MPNLAQPHDKFQAAHDRIVALESLATIVANAVAAVMPNVGSINAANIAAAYTAAYNAAIANGATTYEADVLAKAAVAAYTARMKLGATSSVAAGQSAIAALSALATALASQADPCNLNPSTSALGPTLALSVAVGEVKVAMQALIDNNG